MSTERKLPTIEVSVPTFHEMAQKLESLGIKILEAKSFTVEKGSDIIPPIDWRYTQVRKDCLMEAIKLTQPQPVGLIETDKFMALVDVMFKYVTTGEITKQIELASTQITDGWK